MEVFPHQNLLIALGVYLIMKQILIVLFLFSGRVLIGQSAASAEVPSILMEVKNKQDIRVKQGLITLTAWGGVNVVGGLLLRAQNEGQTRYFHEMNAGFNTVNLTLGTLGLIDLRRERPSAFVDLYRHQQKLEKIYLINTGLDLAYMCSGWAIYNKGLSQTGVNQQRSFGYGKSLLLQGGFLLAYDLFMLARIRPTGKTLNQFFERVQVNGAGFKISLD